MPATLREFAGLNKDVVLTGNLTRIEVWSKEKWLENSNYEDMDAIAEYGHYYLSMLGEKNGI